MKDVRDELEKRSRELDAYLRFLEQVTHPDVVLSWPTKRGHRTRSVDSTQQRVMKATALLMMYNLVECSIRGGLQVMCDEIESKSATYVKLRMEVRKLWVDSRYHQINDPNSSANTYRDLARDLIEEVVCGEVVRLSARELPISGNLDADKVRELCGSFGVSVGTHWRARGGGELEVVKRQRNELAHGVQSFSECGRNFAVSDLLRIKREMITFVRSILRNIANCVSRGAYRKT